MAPTPSSGSTAGPSSSSSSKNDKIFNKNARKIGKIAAGILCATSINPASATVLEEYGFIFPANEAVVFGKYVYDYNPRCFPPAKCELEDYPGLFSFEYKAQLLNIDDPLVKSSNSARDNSEMVDKGMNPLADEYEGLYLGLLDDEIHSFPKLFPGEDYDTTFVALPNKGKAQRTCDDIFKTAPGNWVPLKIEDHHHLHEKQMKTGHGAGWSPAYTGFYLEKCVPGDNCKQHSTMQQAKEACVAKGHMCGGIVSRPCDPERPGARCKDADSQNPHGNDEMAAHKLKVDHVPVHHWEIRMERHPKASGTMEITYLKQNHDAQEQGAQTSPVEVDPDSVNTLQFDTAGLPQSDGEHKGTIDRNASTSKMKPKNPFFKHRYQQLILQKCRRRVWHFVLLNCRKHDEKPVFISYSAHAMNLLNAPYQEFGADEIGQSTFMRWQFLFLAILNIYFFFYRGKATAWKQRVVEYLEKCCPSMVPHFLYQTGGKYSAVGGDAEGSAGGFRESPDDRQRRMAGYDLENSKDPLSLILKFFKKAIMLMFTNEAEIVLYENEEVEEVLNITTKEEAAKIVPQKKINAMTGLSANAGNVTNYSGEDVNIAGGKMKTISTANLSAADRLEVLDKQFQKELVDIETAIMNTFAEFSGGLNLVSVFIIATLTALFGCFIRVIHFRYYAMNGIGLPWMDVMGRLELTTSRCTLNLLFIYLATSTRGTSGDANSGEDNSYSKLSYVSKNSATNLNSAKICGFFLLCNLLLSEWAHGRHLNQLTTVYIYDTFPGRLVVLMDIGMFMWYLYLLQQSMIQDTRYRPRLFYQKYGFLMGLWFLALPVSTFLIHFCDPWVMKKMSTMIMMVSHCYGLAIATYLFSPTGMKRWFSDLREEDARLDLDDVTTQRQPNMELGSTTYQNGGLGGNISNNHFGNGGLGGLSNGGLTGGLSNGINTGLSNGGLGGNMDLSNMGINMNAVNNPNLGGGLHLTGGI